MDRLGYVVTENNSNTVLSSKPSVVTKVDIQIDIPGFVKSDDYDGWGFMGQDGRYFKVVDKDGNVMVPEVSYAGKFVGNSDNTTSWNGVSPEEISGWGPGLEVYDEKNGFPPDPQVYYNQTDKVSYSTHNQFTESLYAIYEYKGVDVPISWTDVNKTGTGVSSINFMLTDESLANLPDTSNAKYNINTNTLTSSVHKYNYSLVDSSGTEYIRCINGNIKVVKDDAVPSKLISKPYVKITLNKDKSTSEKATGGTDTLWQQYDVGIFDSQAENHNKLTKITIPTLTGYDFKGYYTAANGGGTQRINASGTILSNFQATTYTSDGNLYAYWTPKNIKITLDLNGGTTQYKNTIWERYGVGIYSASGDKDDAPWTGLSKKSVWSGHEFKGYYTAKEGGLQIIKADGSINTANLNNYKYFTVASTIFAQWDETIFTVTLNNGTGTTGGKGYLYELINTGWSFDSNCSSLLTGDKMTDLPKKSGCIFDGYWSAASGGTKYVDKDGKITASKALLNVNNRTTTWYAHYKIVTKITLNLNGGNRGDSPEFLYHKEGEGAFTNEECTTPFSSNIAIPNKVGCIFKGYYYRDGTCYIDASGKKSTAWSNTIFDRSTGVELTAQWDNAIYKVELYNGAGTTGGKSALYELMDIGWSFDSDCSSLLVNDKMTDLPKKSGYAFDGYWSEASGGVECVNANGTIVASKALLNENKPTTRWYAQYKPVTKVHLKLDGGERVSSPEWLYHKEGEGAFTDEDCTTPFSSAISKPYRVGYYFAGYYKDGTCYIDASGNKSTAWSNTVFDGLTEVELTTKWDAMVVTITLDASCFDLTDAGTRFVYIKYGEGKYYDPDCSKPITEKKINVPKSQSSKFVGYYYIDNEAYIDSEGNFTEKFTDTAFSVSNVYFTGKWGKIVSLNTDGGVAEYNGEVVDEIYYEERDRKAYIGKTVIEEYDKNKFVITKTGHKFLGFFSSFNNDLKCMETTKDLDMNNLMMEAYTNCEIIAKWNSEVYYITLDDKKGGIDGFYEVYGKGFNNDGSDTNVSLTHLSKTPKKDNYDFVGYFTEREEGKGDIVIASDGEILIDNQAVTSDDITYYAHYNINKYTINFKLSDSEYYEWYDEVENKNIHQITKKYGVEVALPKAPKKDGHEFKGWFTKEGTQFTGGNDLPLGTSLSVDVFARLDPKEFDVKLNKNGADTQGTTKVHVKYSDSVTITDGTADNGKITIPKWTGHKFKGYYDSATGTTQYIKEDGTINFTSTTFTDEKTIVAQWDLDEYTIYFAKNDGTDTVVTTVSKTWGIDISTPAAPEREGYKFIEWNEKANGTGNEYTGYDLGDGKSDQYVYAKWDNMVYKVSLIATDANVRGTEAVYEKYNVGIYKEGASGILTICDNITIPNKAGYDFKGYFDSTGATKYINADGTINTSNFKKITFTADTDIYAMWDVAVYKINLIATDTSVRGTEAVYEKYNSGIYAEENCTTLITSVATPSKVGRKFLGYFDSTYTTQYINADGTINETNFTNTTFTEETDIYARWDSIVYKVSLDVNDGDTQAFSEIYEVYNEGWSLDSTGSPILLDKKIGRDKLATKSNAIFEGYYDTPADVGGTMYIDKDGNILMSDTFVTDDTKVLYARYTDVYTIILDDATNGMSGGDGQIYKLENGGLYKDLECTISISSVSIPTKNGNVFIGYYSEPIDGIKYIDENGNLIKSVFGDENKTIYAQAKENQYKIIYVIGTDSDITISASLSPDADGNVVFEGSGNTPAYFLGTDSCAKLGRKLAGWQRKENNVVVETFALGEKIPGSFVGELILYPAWVESPYTVKFDVKGASVSEISDRTYVYPVVTNEALPIPSDWIGYEFLGWHHKEDCSDTAIYNSNEINVRYIDTNTNTVTLYAKWKDIRHIVKIHTNEKDGETSKAVIARTSMYVTDGYPMTDLPIGAGELSRKGYDFVKVTDNPEGNGISYTKATIASESITDLYIIWKAKKNIVKFNTVNGVDYYNHDSNSNMITIFDGDLYGEYEVEFDSVVDFATPAVVTPYSFIHWKVLDVAGQSIKYGDKWTFENSSNVFTLEPYFDGGAVYNFYPDEDSIKKGEEPSITMPFSSDMQNDFLNDNTQAPQVEPQTDKSAENPKITIPPKTAKKLDEIKKQSDEIKKELNDTITEISTESIILTIRIADVNGEISVSKSKSTGGLLFNSNSGLLLNRTTVDMNCVNVTQSENLKGFNLTGEKNDPKWIDKDGKINISEIQSFIENEVKEEVTLSPILGESKIIVIEFNYQGKTYNVNVKEEIVTDVNGITSWKMQEAYYYNQNDEKISKNGDDALRNLINDNIMGERAQDYGFVLIPRWVSNITMDSEPAVYSINKDYLKIFYDDFTHQNGYSPDVMGCDLKEVKIITLNSANSVASDAQQNFDKIYVCDNNGFVESYIDDGLTTKFNWNNFSLTSSYYDFMGYQKNDITYIDKDLNIASISNFSKGDILYAKWKKNDMTVVVKINDKNRYIKIYDFGTDEDGDRTFKCRVDEMQGRYSPVFDREFNNVANAIKNIDQSASGTLKITNATNIDGSINLDYTEKNLAIIGSSIFSGESTDIKYEKCVVNKEGKPCVLYCELINEQ